MRAVKVGLLGTSHVHAGTYLKCLQRNPNVQVVGVFDNRKEALRDPGVFDVLKRYESPQALLEQRPDLVFLCAENTKHVELFRQAADAGVDVICEKPLATTAEDLIFMRSHAKAKRIRLMTTYPNRYIHAYQRALKAYREGDLGRLIGIKATNKGELVGGWFKEPELSGGGAIMDHTVHVADLCNHLLGEAPVWVRAVCATRLHESISVDDVALVSFTYPSGVFVTLDTSWSRTGGFPYARDLTLHLIGDKSSVMVDYFAEHLDVYRNDVPATWRYYGEDKDQLMVDDLIDAYLSGREFGITGQDGVLSALVAVAAYKSVRENRPVNLSELDPELSSDG